MLTVNQPGPVATSPWLFFCIGASGTMAATYRRLASMGGGFTHADPRRAHRRDAPAAPGQPGRLPVQGQARPRALRREGELDPQARGLPFLEARDARHLRDARPDRDD